MARRTIYLPDDVDGRVRSAAEEGESFSAAVTRLLEAGLRSRGDQRPLPYAGVGEGGPEDLGVDAERYLRALVADADR